jgi:hypothetical protein
MVTETVRVITGHGPELAGKLMFFDLRDYSFETIKLGKVDNCNVCGVNPEPVSETGTDGLTEICGREGRRVFVFNPKEYLALSREEILSILESKSYETHISGRLGTSFKGDGDMRGSILSSGVIIIEGVNEEQVATSIRDSLLK